MKNHKTSSSYHNFPFIYYIWRKKLTLIDTQGWHKITSFSCFSFLAFSYLYCFVLTTFKFLLFLHHSMVIGWLTQHLNRAFRTVVKISVCAFSSILTTSVKCGLTSGLPSQQRVMISLRIGRQSMGMFGRTPLLTTANAACTAVMFWKGSIPVMSSHRTMPKL